MANVELRGRSAATLHLRVPKVSSLHGIVQTEPVYIRNLQWRLRVKPSLDADGNTQALGAFLYCEGLRESKTWSCKAAATLCLLPQKPGILAHYQELTTKFHSDAMDWGYSQFCEWASLEGYINVEGDYLDLEVDIEADEPNYQGIEASQETIPVTKAKLEIEVGAERPNGILQWKTIAGDLIQPQNWKWYSIPTFIRGLKWRVAVELEIEDNSDLTKSLGVYLRFGSMNLIMFWKSKGCADGHLNKAQWKCSANIRFMVKANEGRPAFFRDMTHVFQSGSNNQAGIDKFITVEPLLKPCNGRKLYNSIELEVWVEAEVPIVTTNLENVAQKVMTEEQIEVEFQRKSLRCPICYDIPRAEIYQCLNGHTICSDCKSEWNKCPQCRMPLEVEGQLIRNRALESLMVKVPFQ